MSLLHTLTVHIFILIGYSYAIWDKTHLQMGNQNPFLGIEVLITYTNTYTKVLNLSNGKTPQNENNLIWRVLAKAQPYSQVTGLCQLCTREKCFIVFKSELCTLNTKNKLLYSGSILERIPAVFTYHIWYRNRGSVW